MWILTGSRFGDFQGLVLCDVDADDTPMVWTNQAFRKITGYSKEECLHRNCRSMPIPSPAQPRETSAIMRAPRGSVTL